MVGSLLTNLGTGLGMIPLMIQTLPRGDLTQTRIQRPLSPFPRETHLQPWVLPWTLGLIKGVTFYTIHIWYFPFLTGSSWLNLLLDWVGPLALWILATLSLTLCLIHLSGWTLLDCHLHLLYLVSRSQQEWLNSRIGLIRRRGVDQGKNDQTSGSDRTFSWAWYYPDLGPSTFLGSQFLDWVWSWRWGLRFWEGLDWIRGFLILW